jgi:hypothetical protein
LTGIAFAAGDTVEWGSLPLTSTFISSTKMQAQVPASVLATPGTTTVIVVMNPPWPLNYGSNFSVETPPLQGNDSYSASTVQTEANDMVWDAASQQIYLSVPGTSGSNTGAIAALNPSTGQLGSTIATGGGPDRLAVTADGSYLYAGIDESGVIQRFELPSLTPDISIPLGTSATYGNPPYFALDLEADPQDPHTIAAVRGATGYGGAGGVMIYDDSTALADSTSGNSQGALAVDSVLWDGNTANLFGIASEVNPTTPLYILPVGPSGVTIDTEYQLPISYIGAEHYDPTTGYLYTDSGQVIDPSNGTVVGAFPTDTIQGGFQSFPFPAMVPDGILNIAYFAGLTKWGQVPVIEAFDLTDFKFLGAVPIPLTCQADKMIRWGPNGLALLAQVRNSVPAQPGTAVCLVSGAFVTSPASQ